MNYFLLFIWKIRAARVLAYFQMVNCYHSLISMQVQTMTDLNYSFWFVLLIMMNRVEECVDGHCGEAGTRACEEAMPLSRALRIPSTINCVILGCSLCVPCVAMYLYVGFLLGGYFLMDLLISV